MGSNESRFNVSLFVRDKSPDKTHIWIWAPCGSVILVYSLTMKSKKGWLTSIFYTCSTHACHIHNITEADCWVQNGSPRGYQFLTSRTTNRVKNCCVLICFIPSLLIGLWCCDSIPIDRAVMLLMFSSPVAMKRWSTVMHPWVVIKHNIFLAWQPSFCWRLKHWYWFSVQPLCPQPLPCLS